VQFDMIQKLNFNSFHIRRRSCSDAITTSPRNCQCSHHTTSTHTEHTEHGMSERGNPHGTYPEVDAILHSSRWWCVTSIGVHSREEQAVAKAKQWVTFCQENGRRPSRHSHDGTERRLAVWLQHYERLHRGSA